jgi:hypothetical protein
MQTFLDANAADEGENDRRLKTSEGYFHAIVCDFFGKNYRFRAQTAKIEGGLFSFQSKHIGSIPICVS